MISSHNVTYQVFASMVGSGFVRSGINNLFVEYDALRRLGIDDPQGYVTRRYCAPAKESEVLQLATCAVGETVLRELEGAVEDIHNSEVEWIDVLVGYLANET